MSIKIKVSYTDKGELSQVIKCLAPLNLTLKLPKNAPLNGFYRAYLTSKNSAKHDK